MNKISHKPPLHSSNLLYSYLTLCPFTSVREECRSFWFAVGRTTSSLQCWEGSHVCLWTQLWYYWHYEQGHIFEVLFEEDKSIWSLWVGLAGWDSKFFCWEYCGRWGSRAFKGVGSSWLMGSIIIHLLQTYQKQAMGKLCFCLLWFLFSQDNCQLDEQSLISLHTKSTFFTQY